MWTYQQSYDKLTAAYIHGQVEPWSLCFCFVGNLLNNTSQWGNCRLIDISNSEGVLIPQCVIDKQDAQIFEKSLLSIKVESQGTYTPIEIANLEAIFMHTYMKNKGFHGKISGFDPGPDNLVIPQHEEALWLAFVAGLEKLKEIHIAKGEKIDEAITLTKRTPRKIREESFVN